MSNLPPAAQAAIHASKHDFITADRGHIRRGNDGSYDSRSQFFAGWLVCQGFNQQSAATLTDSQILKVTGTYLYAFRYGDTLLHAHTLVDQTLRRYIESAANFFTLLKHRQGIAHDLTTLHQVRPALHPYFCEQLPQQANWKKPKAKIEPFTSPMFESLYAKIQASLDPTGMFLGKLHAVFDRICLGLFTGSRLGEYGQSRLRKGIRLNTIPSSIDAGKWAGCSLAFMPSNFTFYNHSRHVIDHSDVPAQYAQAQIRDVHIRF
jgi:hypothetical protein